MKKITLYLLAGAFMSATFSSCTKNEESDNTITDASPGARTFKADVALKWNDLQLQLIRTTPGFTPPVASRALGYSNLALYETVVKGIPGKRSVKEALGYSYALPEMDVNRRYNWALAANRSMYLSLRNLYANTSASNQLLMDSLYNALKAEYAADMTKDDITRNEYYATQVSEAIFNWSKSDKGHEAYNNLYPSDYALPVGPGKWVPTPPAYNPIPMLPYWGKNRVFYAENGSVNCQPPAPPPFSMEQGSAYYSEFNTVYEISRSMNEEQKNIAKFWADGGGTYTPPGHLLNIAGILLRQDNANLEKAAETYVRMGLCVADAFIACWKAKFTYNTERPVTYIREHIDAGWSPLIATPPFPEYTSGHSTVSGASAEVLTKMFGDNRSFTDNTNVWLGFAPRTFKSFREAAQEAAMSRLYGGIHIPGGNNRGIECGTRIGQNVANINLDK